MWKFILIDSGDNEVEVENPQEWANIQVNISRDDNWYGVFFDYLIQKVTFTGTGAGMIEDEYETNGTSGIMSLRVEFQCGDDGAYRIFYEGNLSFSEYEKVCGLTCSVSISMDDMDDIMRLKNNYEIDVNLNSNTAFDQVTELTDYDRLNFDLTLPSRGILQRSEGETTEDQVYSLLDYPGWGNISGSGTGTEQGGIMPVFNTNSLVEIESTIINSIPFYDSDTNFGANANPPTPFLDLVDNQSLKCAPSTIRLQMRWKGRLVDISNASRIVDLNFIIRVGPAGNNTYLVNNTILASYEAGTPQTTDWDVTVTYDLNLSPGDKVYVLGIINYVKTSSAVIQSLNIETHEDSYVRFEGTSYCIETEAKSYMINEAVSRISEAITNGDIRFYSTMFGRTDSQPYSIPVNTCDGLMAITNGLNVRRRQLTNGEQPGCFFNLKQVFDNLKGIYHIGLSVEPDKNRPGYNWLRFEDWRYFFQPEIGIRFSKAPMIRKVVDSDRVFNQLKVGFNKWTAGQYTGLDEFMTTRTYRVKMGGAARTLDVSTNLIASTYTIEITRRLDKTTQDWQYDADMFGFWLTQDYKVAKFDDPVYGSTSIVNVLDPDSCYNGRESPARIAMNWFSYVLQGIKTFGAETKLIFSKGERKAANLCGNHRL